MARTKQQPRYAQSETPPNWPENPDAFPRDASTPAMSDRDTQKRFTTLAPAITKALKDCLAIEPATTTDEIPISWTRLHGEELKRFRNNRISDRSAVKVHIDNLLSDEDTWSSYPLRKRVQVLVDAYDAKMKVRTADPNTKCGRRLCPEQYDRVADLMWVVSEFAEYLKEPEKGRKGSVLGWAQGSEDEEEDGSEVENEVVRLKREDEEEGVGDGKSERDEEGEEEEGEDRDGDENVRRIEKQIKKLMETAQRFKKRKNAAPEPVGAKKARTEQGIRESSFADVDSSEDEAPAKGDGWRSRVVSRGLGISRVSGARRRWLVGL